MSGYRVGRILGIEVDVHPSWLVIAGLLLWSLARAALPVEFPDLGAGARWGMAVAITALFFASLLAHELAHSVVARARGIPVDGITFFIFGGMARAGRDSRGPGEEFLIAIAGPVMSFLLAGLFIAFWWLGATGGWSAPLTGTLAYIGILNIILGAFNMLPGFPMDGGRVLRAAIWKITGSVDQATRWASRVGVWMALALMVFGFWDIFRGNVLGGVWLVLIAMFIRHAAKTSYRQHMLGQLRRAAEEWAGGAMHGSPSPGMPAGREVTDLGREGG